MEEEDTEVLGFIHNPHPSLQNHAYPAPAPVPASSATSTSWSLANAPRDLDVPSDRPPSTVQRSLFGGSNASIFGTLSAPTAAASTTQDPSRSLVPDQRPLGTLSRPTMKEHQYDLSGRGHGDHRMLPRVEKDVDDVNIPPPSMRGRHVRGESNTLTTLSRLFAVQAATSPDASRSTSYTFPSRCAYTRSTQSARTAALPDHLYSRGLLSGRHSDIIIHAFGHPYKLHRLILDQSPFFASALSEPWLEANAKEMTVHPEDIDSSITQAAFELALKRLYGCCSLAEEDQDPVGLFATGCWLEMQDLVESSIESMLRQMTTDTLGDMIRLVTNNYYGRAGDKVLASAKSMLCRDGWRMPLRYWDHVPGDIVRELVGGDGFFIDGEFDRWVLAKRILDRRLRQQAIATGLIEPGSRRRVLKVPESSGLMAVRFDGVYRRTGGGSGRGVPESLQQYITLYTNPHIEPLLVLLDEGIHYIHMDFEQLQCIRSARDCLGLPMMSEKVISNALWQQMELRQKVLNAREVDLELGLSVQSLDDSTWDTARDTTMSFDTSVDSQGAKGKRSATDVDEETEELDSGSWDGNGKPRKFWIPSSDCNIVMGGNAEPVIATSNNTTLQRHANRLSATMQPEDVQWAADFSAITSQPRPPLPGDGPVAPAVVSYTHFPPFRFSAEFPNPRLLKEKKRVYSRTVFYAGSLWNVYIQKVNSSRSKQLGVYLHRAKERETEEVIAGTAGLAQGSVDERIGQLEREMIMRSERRERRQRRRAAMGSDGIDGDDVDSSGSGADDDSPATHPSSSTSGVRRTTMRDLLARRQRKTSQTEGLGISPPDSSSEPPSATIPEVCLLGDSESDDFDDLPSSPEARLSKHPHVPALPPYVDARPTIKTYFKIYSPSRGGRMLSVYESAPDKFNFSQSWGWKSSTLMLDEGLLGDDDDEERNDESGRVGMKGKGDGKLRFMVVIGNT